MKKFTNFLEYLPSIYNTRHSNIFSLYGRKIELKNLKTNIINEEKHKLVLISETPHYLCASECLKNIQRLNEIILLERSLIGEYIKINKLINTSQYIDYINQAYPEIDNIVAFVEFISLMILYLNNEIEFKVLVQRRINKGGDYWLLIDGLHRSSILLALNQIQVCARVKFP